MPTKQSPPPEQRHRLPEAWRIADAPEAQFQFSQHSPDEVLLEQGHHAPGLFVVVSGAVALIREDDSEHRLLAWLSHGTCFGTETLTHFEACPYSVIAQDEPTLVALLPMEQAAQWYETDTKPREIIEHLAHAQGTQGEHVVTVEPSTADPVNAIRMIFDRPGGYTIESSLTFGWFLIEVDRTDLQATISEELVYENPKINKGRVLRLQGNTLIGVTVQGGWPDLGKLHDLMIRQHQLSFRQRALFRSSGELYLPDADDPRSDLAVICRCTGVTKGELRTAFANGASSVDALARATGASRVCGSCGPQLSNLASGQSHWISANRVEKIPLNDKVASFRIWLPRHPGDWLPGQNVSLEAWIANRWLQRTYTLTSTSDNDEGYIEITVKREPLGLFSRWLHDRMQPQSSLRVMRPEGRFVPPANSRPLIFIGAGIGITPGIAILREYAQHHRQKQDPATAVRPLYLDYSVRNEDDIILRDELQGFADSSYDMDINLRICDETGYIDANDIQEIVQRYPDPEVMVCGPEAFMDSVEQLLLQARVPSEQIQVEHFVPVEIRRAGMRLTRPLLALGSSLLVVLGIIFYTLLPERGPGRSFTSHWHIDLLWSDPFWKQVSGYHLLAFGLIMAAISARKRWRVLSRLAEFGLWRNLHFVLGILLIVLLAFHTGFSFGQNISFYLTVSLLGVMITGAITGLSGYREWRNPNPQTEARRRRLNLVHLISLAFLPVLLAAHIFSIYYF